MPDYSKLTIRELGAIVSALDRDLMEFKEESSRSNNDRHQENLKKFDKLDDKFDKLDNRIKEIEKLVWKALGLVGALNLIGEYVLQVAFKK